MLQEASASGGIGPLPAQSTGGASDILDQERREPETAACMVERIGSRIGTDGNDRSIADIHGEIRTGTGYGGEMGRREEGEDTSQALGKDDYRKPESLDSYRFFEGRLESGTRFQQRNRADSQDFEDFGWFLRVN